MLILQNAKEINVNWKNFVVRFYACYFGGVIVLSIARSPNVLVI